MQDSPHQPVIESVVGIPPGSALAGALAARATLMQSSQANDAAILAPHDPGGLPHHQRLALACRIARINGDTRLADHYAAALAADPPAFADPAITDGEPRLAAILRHVDLVTRTPRSATQADIAALQAAGVTQPDIVRLSQLIAFVNYQVRVTAGLRLMGAA
jgi:uncharacterized protein YciW